MLAVQANGSIAAVWLPSIAPEVGRALGVETALIGYQVMMLYIGAMATSLMVGGGIARYGGWRCSQASCLLFAVGHLVFHLAPSLLGLVVGSLIIGFAYGILNPPAAHLLNKVVNEKNRAIVFSIRFTGQPLGGVIATFVAPPVTLAIGWVDAVWIPIGTSIALALVMQPLRGGWDSDIRPNAALIRSPMEDIRLVWSVPAVRWLSFTGLIFAAIQLSLTSFTVALLADEVGWSLIVAAYGLTAVQVAGVSGRVSWGWIADKTGSRLTVLAFIAGLSGLCALLTMTIGDDWPPILVYALFFVFGFGAMGWNGVHFSEIARLSPPGKVGNATGASMFFTFSGVIFGPAVFTTAFGMTGAYSSTFAVLAILAALALVTIWIANRHIRRESAKGSGAKMSE